MNTPVAMLVPERIARRAAEQPERTAIVADEAVITYGELARRAADLASRLQRSGVGRDVPVAVCLERSIDLVCASLAVMLAGGAYVVLDPDQTGRRLSALLGDCKAPVLISRPAMAERLDHRDVAVIDVTEVGSEAPDELPSPGPTDLCYVAYTSGSSGMPKGVGIQHDGLANLVEWYGDAYQVGRDDRMTQLARPSFDAYALEVWPCLAHGATLYLGDSTRTGSPVVLRDWLVEQRITVCFAPTPLAEELLELHWPADTALRSMLTGGDRLQHHPPANLPFRLFNNYGPTEVTVVSAWCEVERGGPRDLAPPIGQPLPHLHAYVLDGDRSPVSAGEVGELYVGGLGVARGYLGRSELTAERFFDDPHRPGHRMYATGDRVRQRPDGLLEFLGRVDEQINLHGNRIEPGEIETVLRRCPGVRDTAVVCAGADSGSRLVGFILPEQPGVRTGDVQEFAAQELPQYMVPSIVEVVEELPTTPRGKQDREELRRRGTAAAVSIGSRGDDVPQTRTEKLIAQLWSEVLGVDNVRLQDSFFDLGGDSLLATRVARKAAEHGLTLGAADIVDHEHLHELADSLAEQVSG